MGVAPHAGQVEWLRCRAKTKVACAGRRWGKSYAEAIDLLWFAFTRPGTTQFLMAPTADQSRIIFDYVEQMLRSSRLAGHMVKIIQSPFPEITIKVDGVRSVITARSAGNDGKYIRGHTADRLILDECAYIPIAAIEAATPILAASPFGELVMISTPWGMNHFWDYWTKGQGDDPDIRSFRFPTASNPLISRKYLEQQKRDSTAMAYAIEYGAEFSEDQAAVFKWSLIQSCLTEIAACDPDRRGRYVIGYDPAKWADRSGVVVLDVTKRPRHVVSIQDIGGRDYLMQADVIKDLSTCYSKAPVLLDATTHDQLLEQLRRDRVPATGYHFTNASKQELISGLVIAMEQGDVRFPNHRDLIDELKHYRYELTAAGNVKLGADPRHHDDLVTALALAVWKSKKARNAAAPMSLERRSQWNVV